MANERTFWRTLSRGMRPYWEAVRHESLTVEGLPDVSFDIHDVPGSGWIELKYLSQWPKLETTPVKIRHYTSVQKAWIKKHGAINNRVYLFLQVNRDYLLFDWRNAYEIGEVTKELLFMLAIKTWSPNIKYHELYDVLFKHWRIEPWVSDMTSQTSK